MTPPDTKAEVIEQTLALVDDGKSLTQACKEIGFPRKTVEDWIEADSELSARYLRARANRAEKLFEEALSIQDEQPQMIVSESGVTRIDPAFVSWQNNRVNQRMRMIAKMDPKRYGESVKHEHSGEIVSRQPTDPAAALAAAKEAEEAGEV